MKKLILIFSILILISCQKKKFFKLDNETIVFCKDAKDDSTFNGETLVYNNTNSMSGKYYYTNGILNGKAIEYYGNTKKKVEMNYINGKLDGELLSYDSIGNLKLIESYYYGIKCGNRLEIKDNGDSIYSFKSLENDLLFFLEYPKVKGKYIDQVYSNFFFYYASASVIDNDYYEEPKIFIYNVYPPKFKFEYSLIQIDSSFKKIKTIYEFQGTNFFEEKYFDEMEINSIRKKSNSFIALNLDIYDSINNKRVNMKKLVKEFLLN
jgi:hypothetical protein